MIAMKTGFSTQWVCPRGAWRVWAPGAEVRAALAAAPESEVAPSFIQADHLRSGGSGESAVQRLAFTTFEVHDRFDAGVMARVVTEFVQAHDVFHTGFLPGEDGALCSRSLSAEAVTLDVVATSEGDPRTVKEYLLAEVPGLDEWASFAFAVTGTEHAGPDAAEPRFTMVIACDHLYTDGVSQAVGFFEILTRYTAALEGAPFVAAPTRPYRAYATEQRAWASALTEVHPEVNAWREVLSRSGGMPRFPLPLGLGPDECAPGECTVDGGFADTATAVAFAARARAAGGSMGSALLALLADIAYDLTGDRLFTMMVPRADRPDAGDAFAIGWYVTLVPVQFEVADDFDETVRRAQAAQKRAKTMERLPVFPVIDLLADDPGFPVRHGFSAPMLSYVDVTRVPGADLAQRHDFSVYANPTPAREVFVWINRDDAGLDFTAMHPGTPQARESVAEVAARMRARILALTAEPAAIVT
ncbi:condensation domain-containing protein [Tsukamurella sp. 8F]|uniref:condensation domain-containing protein n=1 Tax=unclassified Tsukamurella TaxID=2633480 RepID=UPI0023B94490|nr:MULTISPECIES: condensation domain-containing protein [unclassified Tsukamurella]MDF0531023.1 condensation domain-containing protein [Tsukamurella sp. 8J]MDF0589266.1 condensation domain-containing protein [Tsukamurella sp. 8F]